MKGKKSTVKGPSKMRGLYTRGNVWWFTYRLAGKKHFHSLGTSDYGEAVQKAQVIRQNPTLAPAAVFEREITAFIQEKLDKGRYSRFSAETKVLTLRRFAAATGRANPAQVTAADVETYYRTQQKRIGEGTIQSYLSVVRSFFNSLVKARKIRVNPVSAVELDQYEAQTRDTFCTPELRDRLIAEAPDDEMRFILFLGFHAGLRKNEIVQARPEWFDLAGGTIHVQASATFRPKDRERRHIPLTIAFRAFLATQSLTKPFVLRPNVAASSGPYRFHFKRPFTRYMTAQGCPWVTAHTMRRTFASLLASAGVSIFKIAKWLGDGVEVTQTHYARLLPADTDIEKAFSA